MWWKDSARKLNKYRRIPRQDVMMHWGGAKNQEGLSQPR